MCRLWMFRRVILGLVGAISCVCVTLSVYLLPCITRKSSIWVLVGIPGLALVAVLASTLRKPLLQSPQLVSLEIAGAFILLPVELILTLFVLSFDVRLDIKTVQVFFALEILIFVNDGVVFLYTAGLITSALLTTCIFDRDVWIRDIDSSPSPFPPSLLLESVFPCLAPSSTDTQSGSTSLAEAEPEYCLPGCACTRKLAGHPETTDTRSATQSLNNQQSSGGSRSQSLIRLPDEFQRRNSILIAFEV